MNTITIALGALGGTVSMTKDSHESGVTPKLTAQDLLGSLHQSAALNNIDIVAETISQIPSSYIEFHHLLQCYAWAKQQVENGARGIVLTQGTDTLEESAFFLDLIWDLEVPLILTGAMRSPDQVGADGAANLLASLIVAASANSFQRGVMVVMNQWIHSARWVEKRHTSDLNAFHSEIGAAGIIFENQCIFFNAPPKRWCLPIPASISNRVFLCQTTLDDPPEILSLLAKDAQAMVISALGAGHVSQKIAEQIAIISLSIPVIISSSTLSGSTAYSTYGYIGSEIDLQQKNAIMGGWLSPKKSRILAVLTLANNMDMHHNFKKYLSIMTY